MNQSHWGEYFDTGTRASLDVTAVIDKSMDSINLFNIQNNETPKMKLNYLPEGDPLVLYGIELHKYLKKIANLIETNKSCCMENIAIPTIDSNLLDTQPKKNTIDDIKKLFKKPTISSLEVNKVVAREMLKHSIAIMLAHISYDETEESALNILTDVVEDFFSKICNKYKLALLNEEEYEKGGFPDPIERVLIDIGMGGLKGLHDYYQSRVIKYISVLQRRCEQMKDNYVSLVVQKSCDIDSVVTVKTEKADDEMENSEVHFSTVDEGNYPILAPCLQLLNSFEAGTNFQNLEESTEVINPAASGIVFHSENSGLQSSFNKKKRLK